MRKRRQTGREREGIGKEKEVVHLRVQVPSFSLQSWLLPFVLLLLPCVSSIVLIKRKEMAISTREAQGEEAEEEEEEQ